MWDSLKRYQQASSAQKSLLWEALAALALARMAMACVPFRRIAGWLGTPGAESSVTATPQEIQTAQEIGWAVGVLGKKVPWDGRCLAQALAATWMLRRRGLEGTVAFGVQESKQEGFEAHAWLRVGTHIVTGGAGHQRFKALTTFARRQS